MSDRPPMVLPVLQVFRAPVFPDEEQTRQARLLHVFLLGSILLVTASLAVITFVMPQSAARWVTVALLTDGVALCLLVLNRRGYTPPASIVLVASFGLFITVMALTAGGISAPGVTGYIFVVILAGLFLGGRAGIAAAIFVGLMGLSLVYLEAKHLLPARTVFHTPLTVWIINVLYIGLALGVQQLATRSIRDALRRARSELAERTRADQALRESESRFRALAHASFEGIGLAERGIVIDTNDQLARMLKTTRAELIGRSVMDFVAPESRDAVRHAMQSGMAGPYEHLALRVDGTVFPVEVCAGELTTGGRKLRVTVIRDMTFRKQAEEALRESAERLRSLGDNLPNGAIYQVIRNDDGTMRFAYVSASIERVMGVTPAAVLKDSSAFARQIVDEDWALVLAKREESLRTLSVFNVDVRVRAADGGLRWIHLCSTPRRLPDGHTLWDGFLIDTTERRHAEEERIRLEAQLRESQKMQALGVLAGGVAHDFNNILAAIKGNTRLAIEDLPANHPLQRSLAEIEQASARAVELVRRILTFSRRQEPVRKILQLETVIEEALGLLRATLSSTIEVRTDFPAGLPAVSADASQIHQTILNLGANAAQAMGGQHGGRLDLRLEATTVDAALARTCSDLHEGRYVRLSITDTGPGMDRATLERIFEPFFTTKPAGQGTGLGLSMVHGIMQNHEGAITVDSVLGEGTTFHLYFPAVERVAPEAQTSSRAILQGHGERVLYVDDEEPLVFLTTRMLERVGYGVTGFTDAAKALEAFRSRPGEFDVAVTDLAMPGMPGHELARELLRIRPDLPIIMTSGYIRPKDSELAKHLGVRDLILKPDTVDELCDCLHRLFVETGHAARP